MDWEFRYFGLSTSAQKNRISSDEDGIVLHSAIFSDDGSVIEKGGKFTPFFDGISYYFTRIPKNQEYFTIDAHLYLERLNPEPDGQDGFALLLRDSIGEAGVSSRSFMTNSAALLVSAFPDDEGMGVKDCVGYRFVWGITEEAVSNNVRGSGEYIDGPMEKQPRRVSDKERFHFQLKKNNAGIQLNWFPEKAPTASPHTVSFPYVEQMTFLDQDYWYIGVAAARGCDIRIENIQLALGDEKTSYCKEVYQMPAKEARIRLLRKHYPDNTEIDLAIQSNIQAMAKYELHSEQKLIETGRVSLQTQSLTHVLLKSLTSGAYQFRLMYSSFGKTVEHGFKIQVHATERSEPLTIYVSPDGSPDNDGSIDSPLDLQTAFFLAKANMRIQLESGVYFCFKALEVEFSNNGQPEEPIVVTCSEGKAVIDFMHTGGPFILNANFWKISHIEIRNSKADLPGLLLTGSNNTLEYIESRSNGNTGIQITGRSDLNPTYWPSNNLVRYCVTADNADPGQNNADGFACKMCSGNGNRFQACIAYNNIDDGWDLFTKVHLGEIGPVVIDSCLAAFSGHNLDNTLRADGNGFKLGGEGMAIPHLLTNSFSYRNDADGVSSNSNPAVIVRKTTSIMNSGANYAIYGQGCEAEDAKLEDCISIASGEKDRIPVQLVPAITYIDYADWKEELGTWCLDLYRKFPEAENWLRMQINRMLEETGESLN